MRNIVLFFFVFFQSYNALASTVTFADILHGDDPLAPSSITEDGVTVTGSGGGFGHFGDPGTLHLDDSGTPLADRVSVTTGGAFNPVSFDVSGGNVLRASLTDPVNLSEQEINVPYDDLLLQGFRGGLLIAEDNFPMEDVSTYFFDSDFSNIDTLTISALRPEPHLSSIEALLLEDFPGYSIDFVCDAPCAHFDIDNIVVNPVPLPAALPLFASVLGLYSLIGSRKKFRN